jgi:hypothetical protein
MTQGLASLPPLEPSSLGDDLPPPVIDKPSVGK